MLALVEAGFPPYAVVLIAGGRKIYASKVEDSRSLLEDLVEILSKLEPEGYEPCSLDEPLIDPRSPYLSKEFAMLKQAAESLEGYEFLSEVLDELEGKGALLVVRPARRMPGVYAFIKYSAGLRGISVVERAP